MGAMPKPNQLVCAAVAVCALVLPFVAGKTEAAEPARRNSLQLTSAQLYADAKAIFEAMTQTLESHRGLLERAQKSNLIVAVDAIRKDYTASRELLSFARELLLDLRRDLALDQADASGDVPVEDPLVYPQLRELGILADQVEQLLKSGERFLALLEKPTETRVERLAGEDSTTSE